MTQTTNSTTTKPTADQQATTFGTLTRAEQRTAGKSDTTEAIRMLQVAVNEACDSPRQQRKSEVTRNSDALTGGKKRPGAKLVPTSGTGPQLVPATTANPKAKKGRVPSVVLREKARWTTLNTEIRTTTVVNTNVGIRIQPATADDYRQLLTEDKPLKVILRGVPEDIAEDEIRQDLARQGILVLSCKGMVAGQTCRPIPLVFVQLTKNDECKEVFRITHVCGINVTVESKLVKKDQVTQCHRCQLYGHGQRNCLARPLSVPSAETRQRSVLCARVYTWYTIKDPPSRSTCTTQAGGCKGLGSPRGKGPQAYRDLHPATIHQHNEAVVRRRRQEECGETPSTTAIDDHRVLDRNRPNNEEDGAGGVYPQTPSGCNTNRRNPPPSQQLTLASELPSVRKGARRGGIAILIKPSIDHQADLALDLNNIETTAITIHMATGLVKLVVAHKAPNRLLFEDDLSEIFDTREGSAVKVIKRQRAPVAPIHGARGVAFTTEDKAEGFAETLEGQCRPVYENVDVNRMGRVHQSVREILALEEDEDPLRPT
ncbi:hypothetical protein Trydic_g17614 [Trypoxylus dichotomus]